MNEMELVVDAVECPAGPHRIPVLLTRCAAGAKRPAVLLLHGLGASKEVQQKEASSLARAGFFAVTVDAPHHGARKTPLLDEIGAATGSAAHAIFLRMVREAIAEIPLLVDHLLREGHDPVGVMGISMGAYVALGAAAAEPRLAAVVSILGSPDWTPPDGAIDEAIRPWLLESPERCPERFAPRAVLLANAGRDTTVLPEGARRFVAALRPCYAAWPERLRYEEYPESGHFMLESDWDDLWAKTLQWFRAYLEPARNLTLAAAHETR
jgi:alpha-beta hydrolase superfamily lysophospholipase